MEDLSLGELVIQVKLQILFGLYDPNKIRITYQRIVGNTKTADIDVMVDAIIDYQD